MISQTFNPTLFLGATKRITPIVYGGSECPIADHVCVGIRVYYTDSLDSKFCAEYVVVLAGSYDGGAFYRGVYNKQIATKEWVRIPTAL